jgi:hypothetical protein
MVSAKQKRFVGCPSGSCTQRNVLNPPKSFGSSNTQRTYEKMKQNGPDLSRATANAMLGVGMSPYRLIPNDKRKPTATSHFFKPLNQQTKEGRLFAGNGDASQSINPPPPRQEDPPAAPLGQQEDRSIFEEYDGSDADEPYGEEEFDGQSEREEESDGQSEGEVSFPETIVSRDNSTRNRARQTHINNPLKRGTHISNEYSIDGSPFQTQTHQSTELATRSFAEQPTPPHESRPSKISPRVDGIFVASEVERIQKQVFTPSTTIKTSRRYKKRGIARRRNCYEHRKRTTKPTIKNAW